MILLFFLTTLVFGSHGLAIGQEESENDELARHYSTRYSIYDEPYKIDFKYHNYDQLTRFLQTTSHRFQNLTALYSIGKSVKGILQFLYIDINFKYN